MHHEERPGSSKAVIEKDDLCAEHPVEVDEGPVDTGGACSIPGGPRVHLLTLFGTTLPQYHVAIWFPSFF